jgi:hypothetical protein
VEKHTKLNPPKLCDQVITQGAGILTSSTIWPAIVVWPMRRQANKSGKCGDVDKRFGPLHRALRH